MDQQQREELAQKCEKLCEELAVLPDVPEDLQKLGDVLSVTRFCLPALARCIRKGLFEPPNVGDNRQPQAVRVD